MLDVFFSNRFELLAERLAERLDGPGGGPFDADVVIVPSVAVRRQLTLELARRHGVCANVRFDYLAAWLWRQVAAFDPGVGGRSPLDPGPLAWRVWTEFGEPWCGEHARLARWLDGADDAMRFELAGRLAELVGQYATYRSDWLERWSAGQRVDVGVDAERARQDERWQGELWRRIAARLGLVGQVNPLQRFADALAAGDAGARRALPPELHVFCQPAIAPLYLRVLAALGAAIDVRLYTLNPCAEYWTDLVDRRRLARLAARGELDFHEEGHRLLSAWGKQSQSQLALMLDTIEVATDDARYVASGRATLLGAVQDSILELGEPEPGALRPDPRDRSLEVHVCHSLGRELEVLQDRLLALFAADSGLGAADVLVAVPDLEAAAPLVDAVFGTVERARHIPYAITGRGRVRVNAAARAWLDLLALVPSRMPVTAFVALLEQAPVAARFGLDDAALESLRDWLRAAGVHWGLDAGHRQSLGLPADPAFTLEDGLDRLLLGYALPARVALPFQGLLPAGDASGTRALALGALWRCVEQLAALRRAAARPRVASDWHALLGAALDDFVGEAGVPEDLREARLALERVTDQMRAAGDERRVPFDVVRAALARELDEPARGGVPTGAVTFTSMASLRNLPFRVVCVLGLDDGAFPGAAGPLEFDLLAHAPRLGDRQRRDDDRNVFLDLVLAARDCLHLSYTGRSVRDNSAAPPSVLVDELLDWLLPRIASDPNDPASLDDARRRLVVEHPLQAFAEAAFRVDGDDRTRSHHDGYARALQARARALALAAIEAKPATISADAIPPAPDHGGADDDETGVDDSDDVVDEGATSCLFVEPLDEPGPEWHEVELGRLVEFFRNPCRYLLRRRLGLVLARDQDELLDDEPFLQDLSARTALADRLLPSLLAGASAGEVRALALAGRDLPAGAVGATLLDQELAALQAFAARVRARHQEPVLAPQVSSLALAVAGRRWRLDSAFADLRSSGLVRFRCDDARPVDYLSAWIHHLALCASPPAGVQCRTTTLVRNGEIAFDPRPDAEARLADLLGLYAQGLREPLYFFPRSAWAWIDQHERRSAARARWTGGRHPSRAESADPSYRLALRGLPDPMGAGFDRFQDCARRVFGPLRESLVASPATTDGVRPAAGEEGAP